MCKAMVHSDFRFRQTLQFFAIAGIVALLGGLARGEGEATPPPVVEWQSWSPSVFDKAEQGEKFVLLNVRAGWSPACQAMDAQTYTDAKVIAQLRSHYISVNVDQDARPDFANHYEKGGWPATVIFAPDGTEIIRRNGFLTPQALETLVEGVVNDPSAGSSAEPEPSIHPSGSERLTDDARKKLREALFSGYDGKQGGWESGRKTIDCNNVEYCLVQAKAGDADAARMARQTLDGGLKLIDPVWGGMYECSEGGDWEHPQFEKTMRVQARTLRIYAKAYALWGDPAYLNAARAIHRYVRTFLTSPEGVVYNSQDGGVEGMEPAAYFALKDAERREAGVPRVDTRVFARENGWFISALCELYAATGEAPFLDEAVRAARWMIDFRGMPDGGFRHEFSNNGGPYLGDTLAMGRALLDLYAVTANIDLRWPASQTVDAVNSRYKNSNHNTDLGFITADLCDSRDFRPVAQFDENVELARFANLLFQYTGAKALAPVIESALKYVGAPEMMLERGSRIGGLLLADSEAAAKPLQVLVIGPKNDATAQKLFAAALHYPCDYRCTQWWDRHEKPEPQWTAGLPKIPGSAAFVVSNANRSAPATTVEELAARMEELSRK